MIRQLLSQLHLQTGRRGRDKPKWFNGWASLNYGDGDKRYDELAHAEWNLNTPLWLFDFGIEGVEPCIRLTLSARVFLSLSAPISYELQEWLCSWLLHGVEHQRYEGADVIRISLHDRGVYWSLLHPDGSWAAKTPRWRHGAWHPIDWLLGSSEHSKEVLSTEQVDVPMPEGTYRWSVRMVRRTYSRKRWPVPRVVYCFEAEPLDGEHIPFPGKGENSWDCGPDALHGLSGPARTIDQAVTEIVSSALRNRRKYGGRFTYVTDGKYDEARASHDGGKR